jgi:hypothetical protein
MPDAIQKIDSGSRKRITNEGDLPAHWGCHCRSFATLLNGWQERPPVPPDSYDSTEVAVVVQYEAGAVGIAREQGKEEYVDKRVAGQHEGREERGVNTGMSGFENAKGAAELPLTWGSKSWGGKSKTGKP